MIRKLLLEDNYPADFNEGMKVKVIADDYIGIPVGTIGIVISVSNNPNNESPIKVKLPSGNMVDFEPADLEIIK